MEKRVSGEEQAVRLGTGGSPVRNVLKKITQDRVLMLVVMLAALFLSMSVAYPKTFPTWDNISAVLLDAAQSGILTVGMMCLLIAGVFDISIGATLAFGGIIAGTILKTWGMSPFAAIIGGLLSGLLIGCINGLIVTKIKVNAMIATLATQYILRGVTQIIAPSGVANLPDSFKPFGQTVLLGLQSPFWVMLVVVALIWFLMSKTRYFRQFYYIGAKPKAAKLSGIKVDQVVFMAFAMMGLLAGLAGTLLASRLSNAVVLAGTGVEMKAIAAAILGGASLTGGVGKIQGALLGAVFMSFINNALVICRVPTFYQSIVVGAILIFALGLDRLSKKEA